MEELIKAQEEYIEFLTDAYDDIFRVACIHGYECKSEMILKGFVLRSKIEDLKKQK